MRFFAIAFLIVSSVGVWAHAASWWESRIYTSVNVACLDKSGNSVGHPTDYVKIFQQFGQTNLEFYRYKEGHTQFAEGLSFEKKGTNEYALKTVSNNGLGCFLKGCPETVGTLSVTKNGQELRILPAILNLCRADSVDVQIIRFKGAPDTREGTEPTGPQVEPMDNPNDHFGPFINFARYSDGTLEPMVEDSAELYCKDSRFVKQPARLASYDEMYSYAVNNGAKGILDKIRKSIYTRGEVTLPGHQIREYDSLWDEYDTTHMMNFVLFDVQGYKAPAKSEFQSVKAWLSSPTKAFDFSTGKLVNLDPNKSDTAVVGCVEDN